MISERKRGRGVAFESIRRITGYLVPDINFWNTAKKKELHDRVKHNVQGLLHQ